MSTDTTIYPITISGPSTHVKKVPHTRNGRTDYSFFPARVVEQGTVVDFRLFAKGSTTELTYQPEKLLADGFDPELVEAGRHSTPPGFVLFLKNDPKETRKDK